MDNIEGILDYLGTAFKRLGPLKTYPALYFAGLFVLVTAPLLIFGDPAQMVLPMLLLVTLAAIALFAHILRVYLIHRQQAEPSGVSKVVDVMEDQIKSAASVPKLDKPSSPEIHYLRSFSSFWDQAEGTMVSVEGTLSRFAPFIIGPHKLKRDAHLKFRKKMEQLEQQGRPPGPSSNAVLSFTAGQMVWRPVLSDTEWEYLGLYQSIVRNSLPVFVKKGYLSTIRSDLFAENRYAVDVKVTGQVKCLPESFEKALDKRGKQGIRPEINLWGGQAPLALYVDDNGSIERNAPARYLDGDIWVAVGKGSQERFISRFLDLSDAEDIAARLQELREEVKSLPRDFKVTSVFDVELWERG